MTSDETDKHDIIRGLLQDAESEASRITAEAEKASADRLASSEIECRVILEESEKKIAELTAAIRRNAESTATVTKRRQSLRTRETVTAEVTRLVEKRLASMIDSPDYPDILVGWIAEAAVGLGAAAAEVATSAQESKHLKQALPNARAVVRDLLGREVKLSASSGPALPAQGVVLTEEGGATAFNNQVRARQERYKTEIRKLIYNRLFDED